MFYSHFILAKKGPLGTIWIAAHLEGKLRKNHVTDTNISASVDTILFSEVPIALRLSGHLLLGVVRIYSRKVNYLFHDCSEALVKIKNAFHCSNVDLPPEASKVPFHSITLPETFDFDAMEASLKWGKLHASSGDFLGDHHVSARDLITLRDQTNEDLITLQDQTNEEAQRSLFYSNERLAGSSDPYSLLDESDEEHAREHLNASDANAPVLQENGEPVLEEDVLPPLQLGEDMVIDRADMDFMVQTEQTGFSPGRHFDVGLSSSSQSDSSRRAKSGLESAFPQMQDVPDIEKLRSVPEQGEPETFLMDLEEELVPSSSKLEKTRTSTKVVDDFRPPEVEAMPNLDETPHLNRPSPSVYEDFGNYTGDVDLLGNILEGRTPTLKVASFSKEAPESAQQKRGRKKRKPVFDDQIVLSSLSMKKQLAGAADLLRQRKRMPQTHVGAWRMQGIYNKKMFARPSCPGISSPIGELYSRITMLSAKEQSNCTSPHQDVQHLQINEAVQGVNRMSEAQTPLADNYLMDEPEAPSFSPLQFPHDVQQAHHEDSHNADKQGIEGQYSGSGTGEQEKECAWEPELGLCDTLPEVPDHAMAMETDDRLIEKEFSKALATEASQNVVGAAIQPLPTPSLASTSGRMLEKLDFLEDNREKALFNTDGDLDGYDLGDERIARYPRRAKDNQADNGWSVRTKCVAKYLKSIFEEAEPPFGSQVSLDTLLKGRTKKEAARMYFETLVLKSRDYINVEQRSGFGEIMLSATPLLKKDIL